VNKIIIRQITLFLLTIILLSACSCGADRGIPFSIENATDQVITISINHSQLSTKFEPSGKQELLDATISSLDAPWAPRTYLFEAKNDYGQIIY
jgi:hypothetical protein